MLVYDKRKKKSWDLILGELSGVDFGKSYTFIYNQANHASY